MGAIGLVSLALHGIVVLSSRSIFLNGLDVTAVGVDVTGEARDLARLLVDLGQYGAATLLLFGLYGWILLLAIRGKLTGRARITALVVPVLLHLALLPVRPYLSVDLFTYLAHGGQAVILGVNPYASPALDLATTDFGQDLVQLGWRPTIPITPYGPLWTAIEVAVVGLTRDVGAGVLLMKAIAAGASLGSGALIWAILGRVRPDAQLAGTLAYLWNPLIVGELAGEGHNDALMIVLVLGALYAAVRTRPVISMLIVGLAVLTKFLPAILLPPMALLLWRDPHDSATRLRAVAQGFAVATGLAALLFAPFWLGADTFAGVGAGVETGRDFASTRWALLELAGSAMELPVTIFLTAVFIAVTAVASAQVRDASGMLAACVWISLAYVLVASPYHWPWHAALPIALMALSPSALFRWMLVVLAAGSRLAAPLDDVFVNGFIPLRAAATLTYVLAIGVPVLTLAVLILVGRRTERLDRHTA